MTTHYREGRFDIVIETKIRDSETDILVYKYQNGNQVSEHKSDKTQKQFHKDLEDYIVKEKQLKITKSYNDNEPTE